MRVNTNIASINAQRSLGMSNTSVSRSLGRLSSGFRINRAADDAAGLGIANQLRADLRALKQASRNAEQSNALLQVAEGGAQQIQGILERMKELATQSVSDNVDSNGRARIETEFQELMGEIDRIADSTKYQGSALLDGSFGAQVDSNVVNSTVLAGGTEITGATISGVAAGTYTLTRDNTGGAETITLANSDSSLTQTVSLVGFTAGGSISFDAFGVTLQTSNAFDITAAGDGAGDLVVAGTTAEFVVGASGNLADDKITMSGVNLTVAGLSMTGSSLATDTVAETALAAIDAAIGVVSDAFSEIGAKQNRLDYASANVNAAIENFAAAESVIRDADMAAEMAELTKNQILQQAGVSVLAQANQAPQLVLRLLQ
ncbi:flagellin N-terminal helical domain-containing protein [Gaopeijia maritima]|uniref:Flagellin n=1 Tax=Gaopeijia maritima TaxID=3119007 RepID=A0ABU9ECS3_9BACT